MDGLDGPGLGPTQRRLSRDGVQRRTSVGRERRAQGHQKQTVTQNLPKSLVKGCQNTETLNLAKVVQTTAGQSWKKLGATTLCCWAPEGICDVFTCGARCIRELIQRTPSTSRMARETLGSCGGEGKPSWAPRDVDNVIAVFRKLVLLGASLKRVEEIRDVFLCQAAKRAKLRQAGSPSMRKRSDLHATTVSQEGPILQGSRTHARPP